MDRCFPTRVLQTLAAPILIAGVLGGHPITWAQEIPVVGQPTAHFYRAQGTQVRVAWQLDRTAVPEDEEIVATLVISGATNPREIVRPDLRQLDPFESRFIITDNRDPAPAADAKEVRFSYRLRPRNRSVDRFPTLLFHYYNPAMAREKAFPLLTAKVEERITVTAPRPKAQAPVLPLGEPEWLLAYEPRPAAPASGALAPSWLVLGLLGPVAGGAWYLAWRRIYPDGARLARMRRTRAARRAIAAFRRSPAASDPPAVVAAALLGYLRSRFPMPAGAATPGEVRHALEDTGLAVAETGRVEALLRSCDEARFAADADGPGSLALEAKALVERLEAA
jgi:hypothetical protein